MQIDQTDIKDLLVLTPKVFGDHRGWFSETWNAKRMSEAGIALDFVQDNHAFSQQAGTLRGLHYQAPPHAQDKLVRCSRGALIDIAVDVRVGSLSFGKSFAIELTPENGKQLLVPKGFLHGYVTLISDTEVQYKCTDFYAPECDGSVAWDSVGVDWGYEGAPILSDKDKAAPRFEDWKSPFIYEGNL